MNFDATSKTFSWPYPSGHRLLHSPSLVAAGLSWPLIGWHHYFVICWSKDRLGLPSVPLHYGITWRDEWEFQLCSSESTFALQLPAVRAVQGDCERVYSGQPWEAEQIAYRVLPWGVYPHSLIKQRKCQLTIIETILLFFSLVACQVFPWGVFPHSLIKQRKCQETIIETV